MTTIRRITVSQVDGNDANANEINEIRPFGEIGVYVNEDNNTEKPELLLFDGVRTHLKSKVLAPGILYGSNGDSGDGAGLDTIKLIPDAALFRNNGTFGNDQYIIVDPTAPNHIHLRAGGTIDDSAADLFLGGEGNHIRVSDGSKSVEIKSTSFSNDESSWRFTAELTGEGNIPAKITFPDNTEQTTAWAGGRVVSAPSFSTGAEGDRAGDLSFANDYIYYCIADYVGSYQATLIAGYSGNRFPSLLKDNYPQPQAGWTFVWNAVTYTIINVTDPNVGQWALEVDQTIDTGAGGTITLVSIAENIWKRVAWSADTW